MQPQQPGQPDHLDSISPATQVAGGALSPRTLDVGASKKKGSKGDGQGTVTPRSALTPRPGGGGGGGTAGAGAAATNGGGGSAAAVSGGAARSSSAPATKSSKSKRKKKKRGGEALEFDDGEGDETRGLNPLAGPSEFEALRRAFDEGGGGAAAGGPAGVGGAKGSGGAAAADGDDPDDIVDDDEDTVLGRGGAAGLGGSLLHHPHLLLLAIIVVPVVFAAIVCSTELSEAREIYNLAASTESAEIVSACEKFGEALLEESWAAGQLQLFSTLSSGRRTLREAPPTQFSAYVSARAAFVAATRRTTSALAEFLHEYYHQSAEIAKRTDGTMLSPGSLNVANLERLRSDVLKGQFYDVTIGAYHRMLRAVTVFSTRQQLRRVALVRNDLDVLHSICAMQQDAALRLFSHFATLRSSTVASPNRELLGIDSLDELQVAWRLQGVYDACLFFLSGPTRDNGDVELMQSFSFPADHQSAIAAFVDTRVEVSPAFAWNATAAAEMRRWQRARSQHTARVAMADIDSLLSNFAGAGRTRAIFGLCIATIAVSVLGLTYNVLLAGWHLLNLRAEQQLDREVRSLERSINRMRTFVQHIVALDTAWMANFTRRLASKALRTRTQHEENTLYQSASHLRDVSSYLPPTVLHPPRGTEPALLTKSGLFLRSHLVPIKDIVAIRTSLNGFHGQFGAGGSKQKGMQHQMVRFLNQLQELGSKASRHAFLNVFGDHTLLWLNVMENVDYPNVTAFGIITELLRELASFGIATPNVIVCAGDGLAGHVSNSRNPAITFSDIVSSSDALVTSFTVFGPIADELSLLDSICQLHEVDFLANDKAVKAYFNERNVKNNDAFAEPASSSGTRGQGTSASTGGGSSALIFTPVELLSFPPAPVLPVEGAGGGAPADANEVSGVTHTATYEFNATISDIHDYTATLHDGFSVAPCFKTQIRYGADHEHADEAVRRAEWIAAFDAFFDAVLNPNTANVSVAIDKLEAFIASHGSTATAERLVRTMRGTQNAMPFRGSDIASIRNDRLMGSIAALAS